MLFYSTRQSSGLSLIDTLAISYHPVMHPVSRTADGKDAPHHREFLTKVGLDIEIKLPVKLPAGAETDSG